MVKDFVRKSLELTEEQWARLDQIAKAMDAKSPTGSRAGKPSWRSLIKMIANEELIISQGDHNEPIRN